MTHWCRDENGTWNGMIGMLVSNEADIATAALGRTFERDSAVTFGKTLMEAEYTLFAPQMTTVDINIMVYMDILATKTWALCLLMIIMIAITFTIINASGTNNLYQTYDSESFSFISGVGLALMFMGQQRFTLCLRSSSSRILFFTVGLCTYILFQFYAADLTTHMIVGSKEHSIKSFDDVIRYDYNVITLKATSWHGILKRALPGTGMSQVYEEKMAGNPNSLLDSNWNRHMITDSLYKREKTLFFASSLVNLGNKRLQSLDLQVFN